MDNQAVIALGSNLGESEKTLIAAAECIATAPDIKQIALSSIYTSEPAIVTDQPLFKNAVMLVETSLLPSDLLAFLQEVETQFGRVREGEDYIPFGPRTLDLDIIDYEGVVSDDPELLLPHPQALHRAFVVIPLLEISPFHVLANQKVVNTSAVDCGDIIAPGDTLPNKDSLRKPTGKKNETGKLFICATPIGNLGDITVRVLETLKTVELIYCEDTRVTRKLTSRYDISTPLKRCDSHILPQVLPSLLDELLQGKDVAFVSDAGTPGISDPGGLLVARVREAGLTVEVLPGASALTTALAASGVKAHNHYFGGFFPRKAGQGKTLLANVEGLEDTLLVFYESVHRTVKTLSLISEVLPKRQVIVARELTKIHEELLFGTAEELVSLFNDRKKQGRTLKGEVVILIAPCSE